APVDPLGAARARRDAAVAARCRSSDPDPVRRLAHPLRRRGSARLHAGGVLLDEVSGRIGRPRPDGRGQCHYHRSGLLPAQQSLPDRLLAVDQGASRQPVLAAGRRRARGLADAVHLRAAVASPLRHRSGAAVDLAVAGARGLFVLPHGRGGKTDPSHGPSSVKPAGHAGILTRDEEETRPMRTTDKPMKRKEYEKELRTLQIELCALQDWVREKGLRVVVVFEGRDGAGKGGTIKAITDRVSPRVFRVVALPAPSDRERSQLYVQRFVQHFPAAGEVVIFDRSWYNRAGVEYVMG